MSHIFVLLCGMLLGFSAVYALRVIRLTIEIIRDMPNDPHH